MGGKFSEYQKNVGVDKYQIPAEIRKLLDDCLFWIDNEVYHPDEISIRFGHRLVSIHPFPNGNGRHSRLCSDILISHGFGRPVFTWGGSDLAKPGDLRKQYLKAIYRADEGDIYPLLYFARL